MSLFIPSLSRRLQEYPAFFNRTTINWFDMWPLKALKKVAEKYLDDIDLDFPLENIFQTCSNLHLGTQKTMKVMNNELSYIVSITPINYLRFVQEYKNIFIKKKMNLNCAKKSLLKVYKNLLTVSYVFKRCKLC